MSNPTAADYARVDAEHDSMPNEWRHRAARAVAALRAEYEAKLATFGMVELAVRNPNVSSYITEWEGRALSAEAKLASERKHADELYAALDEVMTFTLEDFPDMDARHPKACVTPAYRAANVAGVDVLRAHTARRAKEGKR